MFSIEAKNAMLNVLKVDAIQLHSGPPGPAGADNIVANTFLDGTFSAASNAERILLADVNYAGLKPLQPITHISFWADSVFLACSELSGDRAANAAGEYTIKAVSTKIGIADS